MWEVCSDSHAVTIQWVHMGADPLLCVCSSIITIIWSLVETRGLKDRMYNYLANLTHKHCLLCSCWYPPPCGGVSLDFSSKFRAEHFWTLRQSMLKLLWFINQRYFMWYFMKWCNFNGGGPNSSLYFSASSSCSWGMSEHVYLLSSFFKPTDFWVRQFTLSFLSLLLGCDSLDSQLLSSQGLFGSSCFNAFIEMFFLFFCGFPSPTSDLFDWLQMILSLILRQLRTKLMITSCFFRNSIPNIAS